MKGACVRVELEILADLSRLPSYAADPSRRKNEGAKFLLGLAGLMVEPSAYIFKLAA